MKNESFLDERLKVILGIVVAFVFIVIIIFAVKSLLNNAEQIGKKSPKDWKEYTDIGFKFSYPENFIVEDKLNGIGIIAYSEGNPDSIWQIERITSRLKNDYIKYIYDKDCSNVLEVVKKQFGVLDIDSSKTKISNKFIKLHSLEGCRLKIMEDKKETQMYILRGPKDNIYSFILQAVVESNTETYNKLEDSLRTFNATE